MTSIADTTLSSIVLLTAAEHTWPGQIPEGSLGEISAKLRDEIKTFPCLHRNDIIDRLLGKLDSVQTNGDFITVSEEIFHTVGTVRKILESQGILRHTTQIHEPMIATVRIPDSQEDALPMDAIKRLQKNEQLHMILHFTNRVLALLDQTSQTIQNKLPISSKPVALVDAVPIIVPSLPGKHVVAPKGEEGRTQPEEFVWCGINFDKRMKMLPFLARSYLKGESSLSTESIKEKYEEIMGKKLNDANMYALLRNIRLKFEAVGKSVPFQTRRSGGIEFIYDSSLVEPTTNQGTPPVDANKISENTFLNETFDPKMLTESEPFEIRELTIESIASLDLDDTSRKIVEVLLGAQGALHIDVIAQQCGVSASEVNSCVVSLLHVLGTEGFAARIEVKNDYLELIK